MPRLTVNTKSLRDATLEGVDVSIQLNPDQERPIVQDGKVVSFERLTGKTDANGTITFDLPASSAYTPETRYLVTIAWIPGTHYDTWLLDMPNEDADLAAIIARDVDPSNFGGNGSFILWHGDRRAPHVDLQDPEVRARAFDLTDLIFVAEPTEDVADRAFKSSNVQEFVHLLLTSTASAGLSDTQKTAFREYINAELDGDNELRSGNFSPDLRSLNLVVHRDGRDVTINIPVPAGLSNDQPATWAVLGSIGQIPDSKIPSTIARVSQIPRDLADLPRRSYNDLQDKPAIIRQDERVKLAGIEDNATRDQTAHEIKAAYESNDNTNAFTDGDKAKLGGVEAGAQRNEPPFTDAQIGDKAFSNPPGDLNNAEKTAVRTAIGAGTGEQPTDAQIGEKAFQNPPNDLSNDQKTAVRTAIGAGTGSGSAGTDQVARDAAAAAQRTANAAEADATAAQGTASSAASAAAAAQATADSKPDALPAADNAIADAGTDATFRRWSAALIARVVRAIVPAWARAASPPSGSAGALADGSVTTAKLHDGAVTEPKIATDAVTQAKIADDSVGPRELAPDSVRTGHLADNAVTGAKIPSDQILSRHIAADQVTRGELAANSVGDTELVDGNVTEAKLSSDVRAKLGDGSGATEQRVLVDVPASEATRDKIIEEDSQLYTTIDRVVHEATANQASYVNQRFDLGYFGDESALDANFYVVGRYYYNFVKHTPRVVAYISGNSGPKHWVDANAEDLVGEITADVGHYASDEEATPHVNAVGNVYYNERLRLYRRVATFRAGTGPVTAPQRLRQANEDDLSRIDSELRDSVNLILQASPSYIDIGNLPKQFRLTLSSRPRHYSGATKVRFRFLEVTGDAPDVNTFIEFPYSSTVSRQDFVVILSDLQQRRLATYGPRGSLPMICEIRSADDAILDQVYVSIQTEETLRVGGQSVQDAVTDLEGRAADMRILAPLGWDEPIGAGNGIALTSALVGDINTLTFTPSADIPSDASAGDGLIVYMLIPTGSNLSDWRVNLDGFAYYTGPSFDDAEQGTIGDKTVYAFVSAVGDGSGSGFARGTAPGATLSLQHHGIEHHTAYSGFLEGTALAQVTGRAPLFQPTKSNIFAAVKAIFHPSTNAGVTADDANQELDVREGGSTYTLPAATPTTRGGVLGATQAIVDAGTSTGIFGWSIANLLRLIRTQVISWARPGDVSTIPAAKLGSGQRDGSKFLRDDGVFAVPGSTTSGTELTQVQQLGLIKFTTRPSFIRKAHADNLTGTTFQVLVDAPELLTGDIWYDRRINGTPLSSGARTKWTNTTNDVTFPIPDRAADRSNILGAIEDRSILLELWFHDASSGGNVIAIVHSTIGGSISLGTASLATEQAYNNVSNKSNEVLYYWPDHMYDGALVPGGFAVGGNIIARNSIVTRNQVELFTRRNPTSVYTIPDAGAITWDVDSGYLAEITLGGAPRNFQNLVNKTIGDELILVVNQDSTGGRAINWGSDYVFPGGPLALMSGADQTTYLRLTVIADDVVVVGYLQDPPGGSATDETARAAAATADSKAVANRQLIDNIRQLPAFPAPGSRDNKVPKFNGDTLGWEEDAAGSTERPLTLAQQVGLTHANILPDVIQYKTSADLANKIRRSFTVSINDRAEITSAVYLQANLATPSRIVAFQNRALLATGVNDITLDASSRDVAIINAAVADIIGGQSLHVDLFWYAAASGGSPVSRQRYLLSIVKQTPERFETAVGNTATAGNVPVGSESVVGYMSFSGRTERHSFAIALADIPTANTVFAVETHNPSADPAARASLTLNLAYNSTTRTLTYSARHGNLQAIRARGFS